MDEKQYSAKDIENAVNEALYKERTRVADFLWETEWRVDTAVDFLYQTKVEQNLDDQRLTQAAFNMRKALNDINILRGVKNEDFLCDADRCTAAMKLADDYHAAIQREKTESMENEMRALLGEDGGDLRC